jgi:serine phosphatase RsbU (regulator of sigma subunit)
VLRLRIATGAAERARNAPAGTAFDRSQLLLRASAALANTGTADDVVDAVRDLVTGTLDPAYVGVCLLDASGWIRLRTGSALPSQIAGHWERFAATASTPSALAARSGTPVLLPDLAAVRAAAPDAAGTFTEMGWQSAASVPLPGPAGPVGALTFVWKQPYVLGEAELAVLAALAGYVAQALQRADYLLSREDAATVLQKALLSDLPVTAPFEVAARYEPATAGNEVGGDWYDAVRLDAQHLAVVVGDVTGHDIRAAALMGRLRSKLRLLLVDRHEPPSALLRRLETANRALGDQITATIVLAYLRPQLDGRDGYQLQWSNAGHPRPLLLTPAGCSALTGRDPLLGAPGRRNQRTNHTWNLPPGSTVLLYTDGLIETRTQSFEDREQLLQQACAELAGAALPELLDELYRRFAGAGHEDDVVMLALRTPPPAPAPTGQ